MFVVCLRVLVSLLPFLCCSLPFSFLTSFFYNFPLTNRLAGLVVKASASGAEEPGFKSRLRRIFSGSSHTSDLKIGTPVATVPGVWHRVSAGTVGPVSVHCEWVRLKV